MLKAAFVVGVLTFSSLVYGAECKTIKSLALHQITNGTTEVIAGFGREYDSSSFTISTVAISTAAPVYIQTLLTALQTKSKVCISGNYFDQTLNIQVER